MFFSLLSRPGSEEMPTVEGAGLHLLSGLDA